MRSRSGSATRCGGRGSNSTTSLTIEYGIPIFIDIPNVEPRVRTCDVSLGPRELCPSRRSPCAVPGRTGSRRSPTAERRSRARRSRRHRLLPCGAPYSDAAQSVARGVGGATRREGARPEDLGHQVVAGDHRLVASAGSPRSGTSGDTRPRRRHSRRRRTPRSDAAQSRRRPPVAERRGAASSAIDRSSTAPSGHRG